MSLDKMKDGDIYFWKFKYPNIKKFGDYPYWCKSQKAIFLDRRLIDTFSSSTMSYIVNLEDCILEYKGNIQELESISIYEAEYYKNSDIIDMRHSNNFTKEVFIKAGAKRDKKTVLHKLRESLDKSIYTIKHEEDQIIRLNRSIFLALKGQLYDI